MSKKKLVRDPKMLPAWFPLKEYSSRLSGREWLDEIMVRLGVKAQYQVFGDTRSAVDSFERLVTNRNHKRSRQTSLLTVASRTDDVLGVRTLAAFDASYIGLMLADSRKGRALQRRLGEMRRQRDCRSLWIDPTKAIKRLKRQPWTEMLDQAVEPHALLDVLSGMPVVIDVRQDDESLTFAFQLWLQDIRRVLGPAKTLIGRKEFAAWRTYGILPYFDLTFWAEIHGLRYSETLIAEALWPNAAFNSTERLRKVTRAKAAQVFDDWSLAQRLWRQLDLAAALARDLNIS